MSNNGDKRFVFPNDTPGRWRVPADFQLTPGPELVEGKGVTAPPIPPTVNTNDLITSSHENQVVNSLSNLWSNDQWLASQLNAGAIGAVPITRRVIAGTGLSGGGPLSGDVTLNAALASSDISAGGGVVTSASYPNPAWIPSYAWGKITGAPPFVDSSQTYANPAWLTSLAWAKITGVPSNVTNAVDTTQTYSNPAWLASLAWAKITGAPPFVDSSQTYSDPAWLTALAWAKVTGAPPFVDSSQTYSNPAWLTSLAWAKITGAPPILSDPTSQKGDMMARSASALGALAVGANGTVLTADSTQALGVRWSTPAGASQTPWTQDINAAGFKLYSTGNVGIGVASPTAQLQIGGSTTPTILLDQGTTARGRVAQYLASHNIRLTVNAYYDGSAWQRDDTASSSLVITLAGSNVAGNSNALVSLYAPAGTGSPTFSVPFLWDFANTRLGIGTTSPSAALHVLGSPGTNVLKVTPTSLTNAWFYVTPESATGNCSIGYWNGSTYGNLCTDGGSVGIGTTAPGAKLDVNGNIRMSGARTVLFWHGDTAAHVGGVQIVGLGNNNVILTPTDNSGNPVNGSFMLGGQGTFNSQTVGLLLTGNLGVNTGTPQVRLSVTGASGGYGGGGTDGIVHITTGTGAQTDYMLEMGVIDGSYSWIQAIKPGSVTQPICLNPGGGSVSINMGTPTEALDVNGCVKVRGPIQNAVPNTGAIDYANPWMRHLVYGPDTANNGGHLFYSARSDGSNSVWLAAMTAVAGIGYLSVGNGQTGGYCPLDVNGVIRSTNNNQNLSAAPSGNGIEIYYGVGNGVGIIKSVIRPAGSTYIGTWIEGNPVCLNESAQGNVAIWSTAATDNVLQVGNSGIATGQGIGATFWNAGALLRHVIQNGASYIQRGSTNTSGSVIDLHFTGAYSTPLHMSIRSNGYINVGNLTPSYNLHLAADSAAKPTTSSWTINSDARLKRNVEEVTDDSLAMLESLRWIRYELNGLAEMPEGAKGLGLMAHELREVMPEAVGTNRRKLRPGDDEETELLDISYHHVLIHAARAIAQLSARVRQLEGRN